MKLFNIVRALVSGHYKGHFGQYAEDALVRKHFKPRKELGICLDVGAYHPFRFNNTAYFWMCGWRCVNVDANPASIELFKKQRPTDTNIYAAVVTQEETLNGITEIELHLPKSEVNSISTIGSLLKPVDTEHNASSKETKSENVSIQVPALNIKQILEDNQLEQVSYINIDIEGYDDRVLQDIDFNIYRPKVVTVEQFAEDLNEVVHGESAELMRNNGYIFHSRAGHTSIYVRRRD